MFIEHLLHAKSCAWLGIQRWTDPVLFSIIHSLVKEKSAWCSGKASARGHVSPGGICSPGSGNACRQRWRFLTMLVCPAVIDSSQHQGIFILCSLKIKCCSPPLFGYLFPYIFRSWHKHFFLREASPGLTPHKSKWWFLCCFSLLPSHSFTIQYICIYVCACVHAKLLQLCLTLCNPMDCSPPGSSVHGIL